MATKYLKLSMKKLIYTGCGGQMIEKCVNKTGNHLQNRLLQILADQ